MNIEQLRQRLVEGKITHAQFVAELQKLLDAGTITQEVFDAESKDDKGGNGNPDFSEAQLEAINKMLQSEADKIRTDYAKKKKDLEKELEDLKLEKMTADEQAKYKQKQLEDNLKAREADLNAREVALYTVDKLTAAELPLSFKDFLGGASKEDADANIANFSKLWQSELEKAVDKRLGENGDEPGNRNKNSNQTKKWSEMSLTEQGALFMTDATEARRLAAQEGIKL